MALKLQMTRKHRPDELERQVVVLHTKPPDFSVLHQLLLRTDRLCIKKKMHCDTDVQALNTKCVCGMFRGQITFLHLDTKGEKKKKKKKKII